MYKECVMEKEEKVKFNQKLLPVIVVINKKKGMERGGKRERQEELINKKFRKELVILL